MSKFSKLSARLCAAVLLALIALQLHWRGRLHFELPTTVVSNDYFPLRASEPYLLFLQEVARRVPEGDRIVVLVGEDSVPGFGSWDLGPSFLLGLSQLPRQIVVPERALAMPLTGRHTWVASFGRSFADRRFLAVGSFLGGSLFQETP